MNHRSVNCLAFLLILITTGTSATYSQVDFDGDRLPEGVVTQVEADKQLRCFAQESQSDEVLDLGIFGQQGVQTNVGYWKKGNTCSGDGSKR